MKKPGVDRELYDHLIGLGITRRAAGSIGADLHDLRDGIAEVQAKLLAMDGVSRDVLQEARWEIELHLRSHLTSLNAELRSLVGTANLDINVNDVYWLHAGLER